MKITKVLFVGDKPSKTMKFGASAFEGARCEKRLKQWVEFLLNRRHGYALINQSTDDFAELKLEGLVNWDKIIALGNVASKALGNVPHFKLPHPSGSNRQNNDKQFIQRKLKECKCYIQN